MQKGFKRKDGSGVIVDMVALLLTIFVVCVLGLLYAEYMDNFKRKNDVDIVVREYILRMESEGYLTDSDASNLRIKLEAVGMTELDFTGTTRSNVGNGSIITLSITGKLALADSLNVTDMFEPSKETNKTKQLIITKQSTAKN